MSSIPTVLAGFTVQTQKQASPTTKKGQNSTDKSFFFQSKKTVQCSDTRTILYGDARRPATHITYSFRVAIPGATARENRLFALELCERLFERTKIKKTSAGTKGEELGKARGAFTHRDEVRVRCHLWARKKGIRTGAGREQAEQ